MSTFKLTFFGEIDTDDPDSYYDTTITMNDGSITEVDISFDEKTVAVEKLQAINNWLNDIQKLDQTGRAALNNDFLTGETVQEYIEHHLNELEKDELNTLLKNARTGETKQEKMLHSLQLKRIGFYPETAERFVSLDYSLSGELTDYLVVLDFSEEGNLEYITMES